MIEFERIFLVFPCLLAVVIYVLAGAIRKVPVFSMRYILNISLILYSFLILACLYFPLRISVYGDIHPSVDINWIPIRGILSYFSQMTASGHLLGFLRNVIGNLAVFAPLAVLLSLRFPVHPRRTFLLIALASLLAEPLQGILQLLGSGYNRVIDVDDLLLNTIGGIGTWFVCRLIYRLRQWNAMFQPAPSA